MLETLPSSQPPTKVLERLASSSKVWRDSERPRYLTDLGVLHSRARIRGTTFRLTLGPVSRGRIRFEAVGHVVPNGPGSTIRARIRPTITTWVEFGIVITTIALGSVAMAMPSLGAMAAIVLAAFLAVSWRASAPYAEALRALLQDAASHTEAA
jgi:hypothetical protein